MSVKSRISKLTHTACSKSTVTVTYQYPVQLSIYCLQGIILSVFLTKRDNVKGKQKTLLIEGLYCGRGRTRTYDHRLVRAAL